MTTSAGEPKIFLSHNAADKQLARTLGGQLRLFGADVWFDEWKIRPGDSIPEKLGEGLDTFEIFLLMWSVHAAQSTWVQQEFEIAVVKRVSKSERRIIPLVLDATPLPTMLGHLKYVTIDPNNVSLATMAILGIDSKREFLRAIQAGFDRLGLDYKEYWGVGVLFCCPSCGAGLEALTGMHAIDDEHDRSYAGARCTECGWNDGSEL